MRVRWDCSWACVPVETLKSSTDSLRGIDMQLKLSSLVLLSGLVFISAPPKGVAGEEGIQLKQATEIPEGADPKDVEFAQRVQADKNKELQEMKDGFTKLAEKQAELKKKRDEVYDVLGKGDVTID